MSVLRSTDNHSYQHSGVTVDLNISRFNPGSIQLLYSWLEIWLFRHCKSGWKIEVITDDTPYVPCKSILSVRFDDVREAVYFKLSPEYLKVHV